MARGTLSSSQVLRAALIVLLGFATSGLLGLLRVAIVSAAFGTSEAADAFTAAQRLPEAIFTLVAGGALGSSFIPVFARMRQQDEGQAWRLASATLTISALAAGVLGIIVAVFAEPIVRVAMLPGRSDEAQTLTIDLMRLMMVTPFVFSISGLFMGILQSSGRFLLPSIAISMNNIGIIVGALVIAPLLPAADGIAQVGQNNIHGLAWGAVLSALLHLLVQLPGIVRLGAPLRLLPDLRTPGVRDVLRLMLPRTLGLGVVQINFMVNILLASSMASGSLVALNTAFMVMFFALGIIGQSVGSAVFPTLAGHYAAADLPAYRRQLTQAMRATLFLAFPVMMGFIVLGEPLISVFERGEWTYTSTQATAWALGLYATGIPGFVLLEMLSRAFYSIEDTWTPVVIGVAAMAGNIALSLLLSQLLGSPDTLVRGAFGGLALANALTTNLEALVLWALLQRRVGGVISAPLLSMMLRALLAAAAMAGVMLALVSATTPPLGLLPGALIGLAGVVVYFGLALLMRLPEALFVPSRLLRRALPR